MVKVDLLRRTKMLPIALMTALLVVTSFSTIFVLVRWFSRNNLWSGRAHKIITYFSFPIILFLFLALSFYADDRRISFAVLAGFMLLWALDSHVWSIAKGKEYAATADKARAEKLLQNRHNGTDE